MSIQVYFGDSQANPVVVLVVFLAYLIGWVYE